MIYQFHRPRPTQEVIIRTIDKIQESRRWDFLRCRVTPKPLVNFLTLLCTFVDNEIKPHDNTFRTNDCAVTTSLPNSSGSPHTMPALPLELS